jgi:hypothetical protein
MGKIMSQEAFRNLDPMSEEFHDTHDPGIDHLFDALDGDVYSQGIKVDHRSWLDMGSEGWHNTTDELKAAAYQVAIKVGSWDEAQIRSMMLRHYKHLTGSVMDLTLETLRGLVEQYPLHIQDVNVRKAEVVMGRFQSKRIIVPGESEAPEPKPLVLELGVGRSEQQ